MKSKSTQDLLDELMKIKNSLEVVKRTRALTTTEDSILEWCKYRLKDNEIKTIQI